MVNDYELMVIYTPTVTDDEMPAIVEKLGKAVADHGGSSPNIQPWGRKKLAYSIRHFKEGNYVLARFKMDAKKTAGLEQGLKISENILRHLLVRMDEQPAVSGSKG